MERRTRPREDRKESILGLVVYSPVAYLALFLVSFLVHLRYPLLILIDGRMLFPVGLFFLLFSPLLIAWAQRSLTAFRFHEREASTSGREIDFGFGPYRFSRNPTYVGLAALTLGFSFVVNSLVMLIGTIASFFLVSFLVVRREEELLHKKYGTHYAAYRSKVRRWI